MSNAYYRSGQAARVWAISPHLVRRLCEAGLIAGERTAGGQWKIPHSEVERLKKDGIPEIPSSLAHEDPQYEEEDSFPEESLPLPTSDGAATSAKAVDNEATRNWFRECRRVEAETLSQQRQASLDKSARDQAEQEHIAWRDSWMAQALLRLPPGAPPETRLAVRETVDEVLTGLGPRHSWQVVDSLVKAAG